MVLGVSTVSRLSDFVSRCRVALTALFLAALTGGVVFRIVTSRGPSWVFLALSAGVLALVAIDAWEQVRARRTRSIESAAPDSRTRDDDECPRSSS
jgi:hypothetical protein